MKQFYIQLNDDVTAWVNFRCRAFEVNYYDVGALGQTKSNEVKWSDSGVLQLCYGIEPDCGLTEPQCLLAIQHYEERRYRDYVEWHKANKALLGDQPIQPQTRGIISNIL